MLETCVLHVVHNAFLKGLVEYGLNVTDMITEIFYWFKRSAARSADLQAIQAELGMHYAPKKSNQIR